MKKTKLTRSLMAACSIVALTAVMYGCAHDGGDDPAPMVEPPMPEPDPGPTDLEQTQMNAKDAADAAKMSSDAAGVSADEAEASAANIADIQTGADLNDVAMGARESAMAARAAANNAMAHYMHAKAGYEAAKAATTGDAAEAGWRMAADGQEDAAGEAMMAAAHATAAAAAAPMEVKVIGKMKSVGETTITVDGVMRSSGTGAAMKHFGLLGTGITQNMPAVTGRAYEADEAATEDSDTLPEHTYVQAAAERDVSLGVLYDSADDSARLTLVTDYARMKSVKVYADDDDAARNFLSATDGEFTTTMAGKVRTVGDADDADDAEFVDLERVGTYYKATPPAPPATDATANQLDALDVVGDMATGETVYTYMAADDGNDATDETRYVVLQSSEVQTAGGDTI
ncbi:MAG: hypothetical protein OXU21_08575 [Chloroflexota bacterium]|nr:hypothetical protein [Chloroflexota bacterium]